LRKRRIEPQAKVDLLEIWHHIAQDSVINANREAEKLEAAIETLYGWPGIGHDRADVPRPNLRFFPVDP
jgi:plasmid stabilization system protein ParE